MNRTEYLKNYMRKWYANIKENQPDRYRAMRDRENKVRRDKWRDDKEYRDKVYGYLRMWRKLNKK
jgi:hypothetical protein